MPTPIILQCASESHVWELVPAAIGAVLGAAASAIPAYLLAKRSTNEAKLRDTEDRRRNAMAAATTGMIRLTRMTNSLYTLHRQIERTLAEADEKGLKDAQLWMKLRPIGGFSPEPIRFETHELAVVFAAKQIDLANDLMLMSERHFTDESAMVQYSEKRTLLGDLMQPDMEGTIGTTMATPENYRRFGPRMAELNDMAEQLRTMIKADMEHSMELMASYSAAMQAHFGDTNFLQFKLELGKAL